MSAPTSAAPRAVSFSPSGWAKPWMAVGAITTGERTGWPRSVVEVVTWSIPASTRGWSCQRLHAATFSARSRSSSAPPEK